MLSKGSILEIESNKNKQLAIVISRDLWNQQGVPYIIQLVPEGRTTSKLLPIVLQGETLYADFTKLHSFNTYIYNIYKIVGRVSNKELYKISKILQQILIE